MGCFQVFAGENISCQHIKSNVLELDVKLSTGNFYKVLYSNDIYIHIRVISIVWYVLNRQLNR